MAPKFERAEHPTLSTDWLAGIKSTDAEAWQRLVTVFGPIVYRWCRASSVPASDAADVVQEVFATVARGIGDFERQKSTGSFRSWLATITRSRAADYFRRAAKQQAAVGGTDAMLALQGYAEAVDSTISLANQPGAVTQQVLTLVRAEFEPSTWDAFWSTTIDGRSAIDVAQATGLSRASVYQAKSRVLRCLRKRMAELPLADRF